MWLYEKTLQPLTEVFWHEQGEPPALKALSVIGYKDYRDGAQRLVEMTAVVDGWEWQNRLEFDWVKKKAWLFQKGGAWGEFLKPGLNKATAEISKVGVDEPFPDTLFEPR